jgi:hypothetical protein
MLCKKVLPLLSEFFDEALDADTSVQVSQHLNQCLRCRKEFNSLSALHNRLRSLNKVEAPEYLHNLVRHRLANMQRDTWRLRLRNALELRWSKIRTTEGIWYLTRALGTVMTSVFFFLISGAAISPLYVEVNAPPTTRRALINPYGQQVGQNVLMKLGMLPAQAPKMRVVKSDPAINDLYFLNFAQSISQAGKDDTLSVLTVVDPSGAAKIQNVLEYPNDHDLLRNFNEMISSATCRPASENGEPVPSHLVLMFSKISVYD